MAAFMGALAAAIKAAATGVYRNKLSSFVSRSLLGCQGDVVWCQSPHNTRLLSFRAKPQVLRRKLFPDDRPCISHGWRSPGVSRAIPLSARIPSRNARPGLSATLRPAGAGAWERQGPTHDRGSLESAYVTNFLRKTCGLARNDRREKYAAHALTVQYRLDTLLQLQGPVVTPGCLLQTDPGVQQVTFR